MKYKYSLLGAIVGADGSKTNFIGMNTVRYRKGAIDAFVFIEPRLEKQIGFSWNRVYKDRELRTPLGPEEDARAISVQVADALRWAGFELVE